MFMDMLLVDGQIGNIQTTNVIFVNICKFSSDSQLLPPETVRNDESHFTNL